VRKQFNVFINNDFNPIKKRQIMAKAAPKRVSKSKSKALSVMSAVVHNAAERHELIAREAYFSAERRGFQGGDPVADWLEAEAAIDGNSKTA
jgi:hypothetical protein